MDHIKKFSIASVIFILFSINGNAQINVGIKTNLPHWATLTPNIGVEVALSNNITFELSGGYNPFELEGKHWKHWIIWPEIRYWFWESFNGHSVGVHGVFSEFNIAGLDLPVKKLASLKERRYEGEIKGVGISYGYAWIIGNSLLLEVTAGVGYGRLNYDVFTKGEKGMKINEGRKHYIGPTKGAVSLVYVF